MILVVDDSLEICELMKLALKHDGHCVTTASNGVEALKILDAGDVPCLIFLDRQMDIMDGNEFLDQLIVQYPEYTKSIPIVLLSGSDEESQHSFVKCVVKKPIDLDDLSAIADKYR
jgi:CheY-like chemotaxis protein